MIGESEFELSYGEEYNEEAKSINPQERFDSIYVVNSLNYDYYTL